MQLGEGVKSGRGDLDGVERVLMTVGEVAEMCQVHRKTVTRAIARGELRAARLGARGAYRLRIEDVDAWIASRLLPALVPTSDAEARVATRPMRGFLTA